MISGISSTNKWHKVSFTNVCRLVKAKFLFSKNLKLRIQIWSLNYEQVKRIILNSFKDPHNDPVKVFGAITTEKFIEDDSLHDMKKHVHLAGLKKPRIRIS